MHGAQCALHVSLDNSPQMVEKEHWSASKFEWNGDIASEERRTKQHCEAKKLLIYVR